jgi:uncharacterized cupin superfamily protein
MSSEKSSETPVKPIAIESIAWTEWSDVPRFAVRYKHLSLAGIGDGYHVGVAIEELPAGMQTAPAHYHFLEEEHLYLLEGTLTLRLGAERHRMNPGDYVCFPAGQKAGHTLLNEGSAPCRYVIVGENNPNDVVVYTDSNKVLVRPLGRRAMLDLTTGRNYWAGENTGLPAGQALPERYAPEILAHDPALKAKPPISSASMPWEDQNVGGDFGGQAKHLTYAAVGRGYHVGMMIESPAPGQRLAPRHYHMLEEEHALMLEGEATVLLRNEDGTEERHVMRPGDYIAFPAGRRVAHSILNSGTGPCRYLMIGEHNPNEVCVYPDSNKLAARALQTEADIFDMSAKRRYWDGEPAGQG